jgi:DNA-binding CsgD family transcriptional regulator
MPKDISDDRPAWTVMALFLAIAMLIIGDLVSDYVKGTGLAHLGVELLVLLASASGISFLWVQLRQTRQGLGEALADARRWQSENRELMQGLGVAIQDQFNRWGLSKAEAEVGLLLLKGLSHKEIGAVRGTGERTAKEQARAVYRKSGLSGRANLSSFFLEDLLPPKDELRH